MMWPTWFARRRAPEAPKPFEPPSSMSVADVLDNLQNGRPWHGGPVTGNAEGQAQVPPLEDERPWTAPEMRAVVEYEESVVRELTPRLEACWAAGDTAALRMCATLERLEHLHAQVEEAAIQCGGAALPVDAEGELAASLVMLRLAVKELTGHVRNVATALYTSGLDAPECARARN
jgi:hypothetical protein